MKRLAVGSIIIPADEGLASTPSVSPEDRITGAIEVMLKNDLKRVAVIKGNRMVGMVRLEDALKKVGLESDLTSKGSKILVFQGRKFHIEK